MIVMVKDSSMALTRAMECHVYEGALVPMLVDHRHQLMMMCHCLLIDADPWAAAAWAMKVAPWDRKERTNRTWQELRTLKGGRRLRAVEESSLLEVVEGVVVVVMVAPMLQGGLVSTRALLVNSLPA